MGALEPRRSGTDRYALPMSPSCNPFSGAQPQEGIVTGKKRFHSRRAVKEVPPKFAGHGSLITFGAP